MKLADPKITGQLIGNSEYRAKWLELVRALQEASENPGGPLEGWVFHGTSAEAADSIAYDGLSPSFAIVPENGKWVECEAVHFGSANIAAFFAEDLIESTEDPTLELAIFGVRLQDLEECGDLTVDGQMMDCPLYSRLKMPEEDINEMLTSGMLETWRDCMRVLETVVVLAPVPAAYLYQFRSIEDLKNLVDSNSTKKLNRYDR